MTAELGPQAAPGGWQQALDDLERGLQEAARAAAALRRSLAAGEPAQPESESEAARATAALRRSLASREPAQPASDPKVRELPLPLRTQPEDAGFEAPAQELPAAPDGSAAFERVWARLEAEKLGKVGGAPAKAGEDAAAKVTSKLSSLPGQFIITVEDRESKVDLVPLHRALAGLPRVEEVSLVSFANGVPVISLRVAGDLDHGRLSRAVAMATDRECEVIPHENGKLFLRLTPRGDEAS
jgi:hypothetical protein